MYKVGTSILYGRVGVCKIESIGAPSFRKNDGRQYYKLCPVFSTSGELIYVPLDMAASIRPLISSGEALEYLQRFSELDPPVFCGKKPGELSAHYHEVLSSGQPESCLLLIKEIYCKQQDLAVRNKKLNEVDIRYLKIAERLVCEEFAAVLHTMPSAIKERLYAAIDCQTAS